MKVKDLIAALKDLPQDLDVYVWDAGDRLWLTDVDDSFIDEGFIDINTNTDMTKEGESK